VDTGYRFAPMDQFTKKLEFAVDRRARRVIHTSGDSIGAHVAWG
jgi:hypothetical protein